MLDRKLKVAIIDYGVGNFNSVRNVLELLDCEVQISNNSETFNGMDAFILPGVGSFGEAMNNLNCLKLVKPLKDQVFQQGKPLLGICLGMQLLAESSTERGHHEGLSFISGQVKKINVSSDLRLPHMGWNTVSIDQQNQLFEHIQNNSTFYFVHSYQFECDSSYVCGSTFYGSHITAAIQKDNIWGVQFHPERSQHIGIQLFRNFLRFVELNG